MALVALLFSLALSADAEQDCHIDDKLPWFQRNFSLLQFADTGKDMHLSFCSEASNACSIDWYKDGNKVNYSDNSHLTAMDMGKSLLIKSARASDEGNYTCVVSNNVGSVNMTVEIKVAEGFSCFAFDSSPETPDWPLIVGGNYWYKWRVSVNREVGVCLFMRQTDIQFVRSCSEVTSETVCGDCTRSTTESDVMYATLNLSKVGEEDLGDYTLMVMDVEGNQCSLPERSVAFSVHQNKTSQTEIQIKDVVAAVAPVVLVLVFAIATWQVFKVNIQLFIKDHFGKPELHDGRSFDAYISYTWSDVDRLFVLHLKDHLERRGYRVYVPEVDNKPGGCTVSQLVEALQQSRRFIMVLSPGYFRAHFTHYEINMFIEALDRYKNCIIPIVFGESTAMDSNILFRHVIKVVQTIKWPNIEWPLSDESISQLGEDSSNDTSTMDNCQNARAVMEKSFRMKAFKQLLLRMPPRPQPSDMQCLRV